MEGKKKASTNTSSAHIFELLNIIAHAQAPIGAADVSRMLKLPTTTAYRALLTLEAAGYVSRFESSTKFVLGAIPATLVRAFYQQFPLRAAAIPYLRHISVSSGLTTTLVVPLGWYSVRIAKIGGSRDILFRTNIRDVNLLGDTQAGRQMLSSFSPEKREAYERFAKSHPSDALASDEDILSLPIELPDRGTFAVIEIINAGNIVEEQREHVQESADNAIHALSAMASKQEAASWNPYLHLDPDSIVIRVT